MAKLAKDSATCEDLGSTRSAECKLAAKCKSLKAKETCEKEPRITTRLPKEVPILETTETKIKTRIGCSSQASF